MTENAPGGPPQTKILATPLSVSAQPGTVFSRQTVSVRSPKCPRPLCLARSPGCAGRAAVFDGALVCGAAFATFPGCKVGDERRCRVAWKVPVLDPPLGIRMMATSQCQQAC